MRVTILIAAVLAALPVTAQPITPELLWTVVSPNPSGTGSFGASLASIGDIDGDGTDDLAVGAPGEDVSIYNGNGRAYLVSGATGAILHVLTGQPDAHARFGRVVAGVGDFNGDSVPDVAVGAPDEGHDFTALGAAYVFSGATGARLYRWNGAVQMGDFGGALTSPGDMTGDGVPDLMVYEQGSFRHLYVISGAAGTLMREFDTGGVPLVSAGDVDSDGMPDVAVGGSDTSEPALYRVLSGATGEVIHTAVDPVSGGNPNIRRQVPAGDLDGDGLVEMASSAFRSQSPGRVLVFDGATGALRRTIHDPAPTAGEFYTFPRGLAAGDIDADGVPDLAVGTYSLTRPGVTYVFSGATGDILAGPFAEPGGPRGKFGDAVVFVREASADAPAVLAVGDQAAAPPGQPNGAGRVHAYTLGVTVATSPSPQRGALTVSVSPVPSAGAALASLSLAAPSASARVVVVDAVGRTVAVVHDGPLGVGRHQMTLPARLPAGVYAVRVTTGGAVSSTRWVVAR